MENSINIEIAEQGSPEVPSLIKYISSSEVAGFDTSDSQFPSPSAKVRLLLSTFFGLITHLVLIVAQMLPFSLYT